MHPFEKAILHLLKIQFERSTDPAEAALLAEVEAEISSRNLPVPEAAPVAEPK